MRQRRWQALSFSWGHRRFVPMTEHVSGGSQKQITGCTKLPNVTAGKAGRQQAHGSNCAKRASIAGHMHTGGGMKTGAVGVPNATGTSMITTGTRM